MKRSSAIALSTEKSANHLSSVLSEEYFTTSLTDSMERIAGRTMKDMFEFIFERSFPITLVRVTRKTLLIKDAKRNFLFWNSLYFDSVGTVSLVLCSLCILL